MWPLARCRNSQSSHEPMHSCEDIVLLLWWSSQATRSYWGPPDGTRLHVFALTLSFECYSPPVLSSPADVCDFTTVYSMKERSAHNIRGNQPLHVDLTKAQASSSSCHLISNPSNHHLNHHPSNNAILVQPTLRHHDRRGPHIPRCSPSLLMLHH